MGFSLEIRDFLDHVETILSAPPALSFFPRLFEYRLRVRQQFREGGGELARRPDNQRSAADGLCSFIVFRAQLSPGDLHGNGNVGQDVDWQERAGARHQDLGHGGLGEGAQGGERVRGAGGGLVPVGGVLTRDSWRFTSIINVTDSERRFGSRTINSHHRCQM